MPYPLVRQAVAALLLLPFAAQAQTAPPLDASVRAYLAPLAESGTFSGVALVMRHDTVLAQVAVGQADAARGVAATPDTRFWIGSLTKPFTSAAVLRLAADGRLGLDDAVCRYVDPCPEAWRPLTVRHLLSHTSGLPNYTGLPDYGATKATPTTPAELASRVAGLPLEETPGTQFSYSNTNYALLGWIIERVTGQAYGEALQALVIRPLGLQHTTYGPSGTAADALGYTPSTPSPTPADRVDPSVPYAAGAVVATAADVAAFARGFFAPGFLPDSLQQAAATAVQGPYGLGWITRPFGPDPMVSHSGAVDGFSSFVAYRYTTGVAVVVLANIDRAPTQQTALDLLRMADGGTVAPPTVRQAVTLPEADLADVVGTYELGANFELTFRHERTRLFVQATRQREGELFAESRDHFFSRDVDAQFVFERDEAGRVVRVVLHQNGRAQPAERID